jgi:hypothetical protein
MLITGNRNEDGPASLETTIQASNTPASLPVLTISAPQRLPVPERQGWRVCPASGWRSHGVTSGVWRCPDWPEDAPLPATLHGGTADGAEDPGQASGTLDRLQGLVRAGAWRDEACDR